MPQFNADPVALQYEKWVYPLPIMDLSLPEETTRRDAGDPFWLADAYWPTHPRHENLDILVAGCGANAAARYAYNNPTCRVVGVDLSESSLAHEAYLKDKHQLSNLTLHQCRLEEVTRLGLDFDFIDSTGVLHHLPQPEVGLSALREVLRPEGVIFIMLYGKYGRVGAYMFQDLFRLMGLEQREEDVAVIKEAVSVVKKDHYLNMYAQTASDMKYDAGLVDTFLHRQDKAFTVGDCLQLVEDAGLVFQGWMDNYFYYPEGQMPGGHPFMQRLNALEEPKLWQAMELFHGRISQHCFYVCHPDRDPATYAINFDSPEFLDDIPVRRVTQVRQLKDKPGQPVVISRKPFPEICLEPAQTAIFSCIDGQNTVRQCLEKPQIQATESELTEYGRNFFQSLWRMGYLFMHKPL